MKSVQRNGKVYLTLALSLIAMACDLSAGTLTPYEVVVLDSQRPALIRINMDSRIQTVTPIPIDVLPSQSRGHIAFAPDGSIFAPGERTSFIGDEGLTPGTEQARLDPTTNQWEVTTFEGELHFPTDADITLDGNLIVADEIDIYEFDQVSKTILTPVPREQIPVAFQDFGLPSIDIDSSGGIIFDIDTIFIQTHPLGRTYALFRQSPDGATVDMIDPDPFIQFAHFALESDTRLIGLADHKLYRVNLDTGAADLVFESALLSSFDSNSLSNSVAIDPDGRVIVSNFGGPGIPSQLLRIDLDTGTEEVFTLNDPTLRVSDFDLLIIPEPSTIVLLTLGLFALLAHPLVARVRAKSAR
jgi:hypothetical protein